MLACVLMLFYVVGTPVRDYILPKSEINSDVKITFC